jgi:hypothetical protein
VESVLDLTDLLLIQLATLQKVGIPFQSNDLNVRKLLTPLFKPCISMSIFRGGFSPSVQHQSQIYV